MWDALPAPGGLPEWLETPDDPASLASDEPYELLASRLIAAGVIDVEGCPGGRFDPGRRGRRLRNGTRSTTVEDWQDRFDRSILQAANSTGVPAALLKRVFA